MGGPKLPSPEEAARQLARPQDSLVTSQIVASAICPALATVFVVLRIWSKRLLYGKFRLETNDWLCVAALVFLPKQNCMSKYSHVQIFFYGNEIVLAVATQYGFGRHIVFIKDARLVQIVCHLQ